MYDFHYLFPIEAAISSACSFVEWDGCRCEMPGSFPPSFDEEFFTFSLVSHTIFHLSFLQQWQKIDGILTEEGIVAITTLTTKAGIVVQFSLLCRRSRRGEVSLSSALSCGDVAFFFLSLYLSIYLFISSRVDMSCLLILMTFFSICCSCSCSFSFCSCSPWNDRIVSQREGEASRCLEIEKSCTCMQFPFHSVSVGLYEEEEEELFLMPCRYGCLC